MPESVIAAAGGVLWRRAQGTVEVALAHRPRYDDWTFPKGKLDPGESAIEGAVREVREETGMVAVPGRRLVSTRYQSRDGLKRVDYWSMQADGEFVVNDEVDDLQWVAAEQAAGRLSYERDIVLIQDLLSLPLVPVRLLLIRHADAGRRQDWKGSDESRPLSPLGTRAAQDLVGPLQCFAPALVLSADRVRCEQTVRPLATAMHTSLGDGSAFAEEAYDAHPSQARRQFAELLQADHTVALCSQGGVIPALLSRAGVGSRVHVTGTEPKSTPARKASVWALSGDGDRLVSADYYPSFPRLG